jgi:hypothetical protein
MRYLFVLMTLLVFFGAVRLGMRTALQLKAYPNNPAARKAIRAQAKWRTAR